jgi:hypothetical protein
MKVLEMLEKFAVFVGVALFIVVVWAIGGFITHAHAETPIALDLTRDQANALHKLLDAGVKGGGLDAAKVFVPIDDKLTAAARAAQALDLIEEARRKVEQADKAKASSAP